MPGQISIRLSDDTLARLHRLGQERKIRRADLVRQAIEQGLNQMEQGGAEREILRAINGLQNQISKRISNLPGQVRDELLEVLELSDDDETTSEETPNTPPVPPPVSPSEQSVQRAENDAKIPEPFEAKEPTFPDDRRRNKEPLNLPIEQERRQSIRLHRVLEFKGWQPAQLSAELKLELPLLERALSGHEDLAATRVEARLVQWEYEMLRTSWTPGAIVRNF